MVSQEAKTLMPKPTKRPKAEPRAIVSLTISLSPKFLDRCGADDVHNSSADGSRIGIGNLLVSTFEIPDQLSRASVKV